mgnify:CR=1 FL=1
MSTAAQVSSFPRIGWLGALWLLVYLPTYHAAYGAFNFLFLCNIGVILTAIGLIVRSRLLMSSQAVAAPVIALAGRQYRWWYLDSKQPSSVSAMLTQIIAPRRALAASVGWLVRNWLKLRGQ